MPKVKLTVTESRCRDRCCQTGDVFVVEGVCPPLCHELWNVMYPSIYVLLNGGKLDKGENRGTEFDVRCPDGGRVCVHGEVIE